MGSARPPSSRSSCAARSSTTTTRSSPPSASSFSRRSIVADENAPMRHNRLGQSTIFTPEVIDDIHVKSELGRYRMRGFSMFKKIPHWDELMFLPGTLTRFVIEGYREKW